MVDHCVHGVHGGSGTHTMIKHMCLQAGGSCGTLQETVPMQGCMALVPKSTTEAGAPPHRKLPVSVHCLSQEVTESAARLLDVFRHIGRVGRKQTEGR